MTDCLNAGVLRAIEKLTANYPNVEHYLLWDSHGDTPLPDTTSLNSSRVTLIAWNGGFLKKIILLRRNLTVISPDFLHLHSSIAGFIGRVFVCFQNVYYSPHCFAFQRTDISKLTQKLYFTVEKLLSSRTKCYVCNWPIEYDLVQKHFGSVDIYFAPLINHKIVNAFKMNKCDNHVISIGRVRPQKDPMFFCDLARRFIPESNLSFTWLGTGDEDLMFFLEEAGIEVSGWLGEESIRDFMKKTKVQVISSAWESGPFTFYEGLEEGMPSLLRRIPAFRGLECDQFENPEFMADALANLIFNENFRFTTYLEQIHAVESLFNLYLGLNGSNEIYKD